MDNFTWICLRCKRTTFRLQNILPNWWVFHGESHGTMWCKGSLQNGLILLMEEILHHLGCIKPRTYWDKLPINWCRISAINSIMLILSAPYILPKSSSHTECEYINDRRLSTVEQGETKL